MVWKTKKLKNKLNFLGTKKIQKKTDFLGGTKTKMEHFGEKKSKSSVIFFKIKDGTF